MEITQTFRSWLSSAACRDVDPNLFFGDENGKFAGEKTKQAIAVCRRCDCVLLCLSWAFETGDQYAVLGGLTPGQRLKQQH